MKRSLAIILVLIFALTVVFVACGEIQVTVSSVSLYGDYKTEYKIGEELNLDGVYVQVTLSDGNTEIVPVTESMVEADKFNTSSVASKRTLRITYQNFSVSLVYSVSKAESVSKITAATLKDMPETVYAGQDLPVKDGYLTTGSVELTVTDVGVVVLPIKSTWISGFSNKLGVRQATVHAISDYGDVDIIWEYTVINLPQITKVECDVSDFSVYVGDGADSLLQQLKNATFTLTYEDQTEATVNFNQNFKISGFSSDEEGEKNCTLSLFDRQNRTAKFKIVYKVKQVYPVYTVTFDENYLGGAVYELKTSDGKIANPDAVRTGYNFGGWYNLAESSTVRFDFDRILDGDLTLTARWTKANYLITFYDEKGSLMGSATYDVEDEKLIPRPNQLPNYKVPSGYVFSHYTDISGNEVKTIQKGTTGNMVLTAHFTAIEYNVEYILNDNSLIPATNSNPTVFSADAPLQLAPAQRNGYTFKGWNYNNKIIDSTEGIFGDITLSATWEENVYTLTRIDGLTKEVIDEITFRVTDSDTILSDYEKSVYIFYGWYTDPEYKNEYFKNSDGKYRIPRQSFGDQTIYANVEYCYTVSLDTLIIDGVSQTTVNVNFTAKDDVVSLMIPQRVGCTFLNWRNLDLGLSYDADDDLDKDTESIDLDSNEIISLITEYRLRDNTLRLTANYEVHSHVIRHHFYTDFDGVEYIREIEYDTTVRKDLLTPADSIFINRNGFNFVDWYTDPEFKGATIFYVEAETADEDIDVYAKWSPITYTVTLHYNVKDETKLTKANIPETYTPYDSFSLLGGSYPNYEFAGWFDDEELQYQHKTDVNQGSYGDIEVYAKWTPVTYMMSLRNMEYATYPGIITYTLEDEIITLETPTRKGYVFGGWYLENVFLHQITSFVPSELTSEFVAYAKWDIENYDIIYHLNDDALYPANANNQETITFNDNITLSPATRNGYVFVAWYTQNAVNGVFDERYSITTLSKISANVDLYAEWVKGEYTITYDCPDGDYSNMPDKYTVDGFKVNGKNTFTLPLAIRAEYTCSWTLDGEQITALGGDGYIFRDITLKAVWTAKEYTLTFRVSGKTGTLKYSADDFENGVYTLPTFDELVEKEVFASTILVGKEVIAWKINSQETSTILIKDIKNYTVEGVLQDIVYNLTYSLPDGATMIAPEDGQNPQTFTYNQSIKITAATLDGYEFAAWYKDKDYTEIAGSVNSGITTVKTPAMHLTLYAKLVKIHNITYVGDDGMTLANKVTEYSSLRSVNLGTPKLTDNNFGGWWCVTLGKNVTTTDDLEEKDVTLKPLFYLTKENGVTNSANLIFSISDANAILSGFGSVSGKLVLPQEVSGYPVTSIKASLFRNNTTLTGVSLGKNLLEIGNSAFLGCTKITSVELDGDIMVQTDAFKNCTALKTIVIGANVTVANNVFDGCSQVTTLTYDGTSGANSVAVYRLFGTSASYNGAYLPTTFTTMYFTGSGTLNGILVNCTSLTKLYITSEEAVTLTTVDVNVLKGKTVYLKSQELVDAYSATANYEGITFVKQ